MLPNIGARRIDQISVGDTLAVLAEPWTTRPETVRVRVKTPAATAGPTCRSGIISPGEYKSPGKSLDAASDQLRQYSLALENPPLLIVCDLRRFWIRTDWTNSVSNTHEFDLEGLG